MTVESLKSIVSSFVSIEEACNFEVNPITKGLINTSYKVTLDGNEFVLQQVNNQVFKNPQEVQQNIQLVSQYLRQADYKDIILTPITTVVDNALLTQYQGSGWRMFDYVADSVCYDTVDGISQAYDAAEALGKFHLTLRDFDETQLVDPIAGFLDFEYRVANFENALTNGNPNRINGCEEIIQILQSDRHLVQQYCEIYPELPKQVIHGDPKISNFMFDKNSSKVLGLIDWDTLMSGSILYDFGDMVRSCTNKSQEGDISQKDVFDKELYAAILDGYLVHQGSQLSQIEQDHLHLSAMVVTYVQAVRFITDYLLDDVYYQTSYMDQNKARTINQLYLLEGMKGVV